MRAGEQVTVIGAGPVGSMLACMLARRGCQVTAYERRPDLRRHALSAGRSINLAVSTRGLHALAQLGLADEVLRAAVPMRGRLLHAKDGQTRFLAYGRDESQCIHSMSRGGLNRMLMDSAERSGVRLLFEQRLVDYDAPRGEAVLRDERTGGSTRLAAPVIFGTDGSASALRTALVAASGARCSQEVLSSGYKELTLPPAAQGTGLGLDGRFALEPNALHIWPRGKFMLIALPNLDGSFTCTLFLPFDAPAGEACFARLVEAAAVGAFFAAEFADVARLLPGLEEQFLAAPLGQMVTVKTDPWSSGSALLLGDAAHAIVPFFGQGMNSGFEDCALLDARLAALPAHAAPDWAGTFRAFAADRRVDTDAIADLAVENFIEMRDKVADPRFLLRKAVEGELQRRFPDEYATRYELVTFSRVPYRVALAAGVLQDDLLGELCEGLDRPEAVDWERAGRGIRERLVPLLAPHR